MPRSGSQTGMRMSQPAPCGRVQTQVISRTRLEPVRRRHEGSLTSSSATTSSNGISVSDFAGRALRRRCVDVAEDASELVRTLFP